MIEAQRLAELRELRERVLVNRVGRMWLSVDQEIIGKCCKLGVMIRVAQTTGRQRLLDA